MIVRSSAATGVPFGLQFVAVLKFVSLPTMPPTQTLAVAFAIGAANSVARAAANTALVSLKVRQWIFVFMSNGLEGVRASANGTKENAAVFAFALTV